MGEIEAMSRVPTPSTRKSIANDLRTNFGGRIGPGSSLVVHSSLRSIGWVCGGPVALIQALMDVVTPEGNIVVPTHSSEYSDPAIWQNPPVPEPWIDIIRENMPLFDKRVTPTRGIGCVPEVFRSWPEVHRSDHPLVSFGCWGVEAHYLASGQELNFGYGLTAPLSKLYDKKGDEAMILMIGTDWDSCSSFHVAEFRSGVYSATKFGTPWLDSDGNHIWQWYDDVDGDCDLFIEIGKELDLSGCVTRGKIGAAECRLVSLQTCVDAAVEFLQRNRG